MSPASMWRPRALIVATDLGGPSELAIAKSTDWDLEHAPDATAALAKLGQGAFEVVIVVVDRLPPGEAIRLAAETARVARGPHTLLLNSEALRARATSFLAALTPRSTAWSMRRGVSPTFAA